MQTSASTQQRVQKWIDSTRVQTFIIILIVINAIILGMETSKSIMDSWGHILLLADQIILGVFVIEIALRIYGHGFRFFKDPWGIFDFTIVVIALIPASGPLAVLRALRVLRVLRLISMMPNLRFVVNALLSALPGIASIAGLMVILFYVFSVMATGLFNETHPEWFGTLGASLYTLFQVMTLESWSMGIVRPLMEEHPYAWAFFVPFILVATFTILNLFIAIIVDTMQNMHERSHQAEQEQIEETIKDEGSVIEEQLKLIKSELVALRAAVDKKIED